MAIPSQVATEAVDTVKSVGSAATAPVRTFAWLGTPEGQTRLVQAIVGIGLIAVSVIFLGSFAARTGRKAMSSLDEVVGIAENVAGGALRSGGRAPKRRAAPPTPACRTQNPAQTVTRSAAVNESTIWIHPKVSATRGGFSARGVTP